MKKSILLLIMIAVAVFGFSEVALAISDDLTHDFNHEFIISNFNDIFEYDGVTEVVIYESITPIFEEYSIEADGGFGVWQRVVVTDLGVTRWWVWESNPFFIVSVARGMTSGIDRTVSATVSAQFGSGIPLGALPNVRARFGINASGSISFSERHTFHGPASNSVFRSRDFYLRHARNRHEVRIVTEQFATGFPNPISRSTVYSTVDVPAIRIFSENRM